MMYKDLIYYLSYLIVRALLLQDPMLLILASIYVLALIALKSTGMRKSLPIGSAMLFISFVILSVLALMKGYFIIVLPFIFIPYSYPAASRQVEKFTLMAVIYLTTTFLAVVYSAYSGYPIRKYLIPATLLAVLYMIDEEKSDVEGL